MELRPCRRLKICWQFWLGCICARRQRLCKQLVQVDRSHTHTLERLDGQLLSRAARCGLGQTTMYVLDASMAVHDRKLPVSLLGSTLPQHTHVLRVAPRKLSVQ